MQVVEAGLRMIPARPIRAPLHPPKPLLIRETKILSILLLRPPGQGKKVFRDLVSVS